MMFKSWPKGQISYLFYYIPTKWVCEMPNHWTGYRFRIVGVVVSIFFPIREPKIFDKETVWKSIKTKNIKRKACLTKGNQNGRWIVNHYQQCTIFACIQTFIPWGVIAHLRHFGRQDLKKFSFHLVANFLQAMWLFIFFF